MWEHTQELTSRLKRVLIVFVVAVLSLMILPADLAFLNDPSSSYKPLISSILEAVRVNTLPPDVQLIGLELTDPIEIYAIAAVLFALMITAPYFAYQIHKFVNPALHQGERKGLFYFLGSFTSLFAVGVVFGYIILTPYIIGAVLFFFPVVQADLIIAVKDFYFKVLTTTVLTGAIFTFPVFIVLLVRYGIIQTKALTKNRKYIYAAVLVLVFVVTPGEGGVANFLLLIPLTLLFEAGVLVSKYFENKGKVKPNRFFSETMKCEFCGELNPKDKVFCESCGKSQK